MLLIASIHIPAIFSFDNIDLISGPRISNFLYNSSFSIRLLIELARLVTSSIFTINPLSPSFTKKRGPPGLQSVVITGIPMDKASIRTLGIPSYLEDNTKINSF